jgi:hypothetical protein
LLSSFAKTSQHWERLLYSTGGAINLQKSFWYLLSWTWDRGLLKLDTSSSIPAVLHLTAGSLPSLELVPHIEANDSFRTLGVYISPSRSYKKQLQVLWSSSDSYFTAVSQSTLTPDEAYWSYLLYLQPKLTYPLACTNFTQAQCRHIQAPALAALLPKLHLNRHTPHAIIFGEAKYGGLAMPDLYTDQGYNQLKLLLGHLMLNVDNGKLIQLAISHIQLQLGVTKPFFSLPLPTYAKRVDSNWIVSLWKNTWQLKIVMDVENSWLPILA